MRQTRRKTRCGGDVTVGGWQVALLLVANNAMQGVLSSFFFKYADTILKK